MLCLSRQKFEAITFDDSAMVITGAFEGDCVAFLVYAPGLKVQVGKNIMFSERRLKCHVVRLKVNELFTIQGLGTFRLNGMSPSRADVGIVAPEDVQVLRLEVAERLAGAEAV